MRIYLDLNCFNRPFDDQVQTRVSQETAAVFSILKRIENNEDQLVWSAVLTFENSRHPLADRREEIGRWAQHAAMVMNVTDEISQRALQLTDIGFHGLDATHLASAEASTCDWFLTCDDRLLRRAGRVNLTVQVINPLNYVEEVADV